ncbi:lipopolysaccharide biosynthesis protein [Anaerorhabdus furcosa]|nr:hypothetical protein [Anaerorhabdus furcosa]
MTKRTSNSFKNLVFGITLSVVSMLFGMINRKIFLMVIGIDVIGAQDVLISLFATIQLLCCGYGTATYIHLNKAFANNKMDDFAEYVLISKKITYLLSFALLIVGTVVCFNINLFISSNTLSIETLQIAFYSQFLASISNVFVDYKRSIMIVMQKEYKLFIVDLILTVFFAALQIVIIFKTENYILYVFAVSFKMILYSFICSRITNKEYHIFPISSKISLTHFVRLKKVAIKQAVIDLSDYIYYSTDSIVLSMNCGIIQVGVYSNYYMIFMTITLLAKRGVESIQASFSEIINSAETNTESKSQLIQLYDCVCFVIIAFCSLYLLGLTDMFVNILYGAEYLSQFTTVLLVLNFVIVFSQFSLYSYLRTTGQLINERYYDVIMASMNIVLSIYFSRIFGLNGVIIGTIISNIFIWIIRIILINQIDQVVNIKVYLVKKILGIVILLLVSYVNYLVISTLDIEIFIRFLIMIIMCTAEFATIFLILIYRTKNGVIIRKSILNR